MAGFHGIYIDKKNMVISFDVTIRFGCDRKALSDDIVAKVQERYPDYIVSANIDSVFAEGEYEE